MTTRPNTPIGRYRGVQGRTSSGVGVNVGINVTLDDVELADRLGFTAESSTRRQDIAYKRALMDVLEYLRERLVSIAHTNFDAPQRLARNIVRAPYVTSSAIKGRGGFEAGELMVGEVGMDASGISDPTTGRPLGDYLTAIQSPSQGQKRGRGVDVHTRPPSTPLVGTQSNGRIFLSHRLRFRLLPWVKEAFGISGKHALAVAINIGKRIDAQGVLRQPVWTHVFRTPGRSDGTLFGSVRPEHWDNITNIIKRHGIRMSKEPERGQRPVGGRPGSRRGLAGALARGVSGGRRRRAG